jgi:hypothetical protein
MKYCKPLIGLFVTLLLSGCATYADLGQGHVARTLVSEERSSFGTNMGFSKLQHCEKNDKGELCNCRDLTAWIPMWSQGVGGQVVSGALTGLGFGLGSAFSGAAGASNSVVNSTVSTITKGGHH